ncbi:hypothetical protein NC653_016517 [Populus alba x Populus x berolinensis]|uniref:Uncharacterized protein n=1 Tax=Populus alba x Populus x berolinensis TaxID=444605 RepID=A0AAD6QMX8_9ROSI|nr:hypothetical protein NC653_016500 [Populus alba x Populus x berolinensis]KAJ6993407.1 hypothetical protein NC653_016517 [Populus alba x Populus x berolinensis]
MATPKEDERRLYQCARKYEKIVKQSSRSSSNGITTCPASSSTQPDDNGVFVQTITKFLNEMRANPSTDTDGSASTRERDPE